MATEEIAALGRARLAVTAAFTPRGLVAAAWVARIPQIKERLGLSEGAMGVALLGAPVGVVAAVRFAGWAVAGGAAGPRPSAPVSPPRRRADGAPP